MVDRNVGKMERRKKEINVFKLKEVFIKTRRLHGNRFEINLTVRIVRVKLIRT